MYTVENKSIMLALLLALGFCLGPKICYYCMGDNSEERIVEVTRFWACNGIRDMWGPIET